MQILASARKTNPDNFKNISDLVLREIYACRVESESELNKKLNSLLAPDYLPNVKTAAQIIYQSISKNEKILIYGDYDADGATSTALMFLILQELGARVSFFIPNRIEHGYGLSVCGLEYLEENKKLPNLLITVDNGIRSLEAADFLKSRNIKLIITDHHEADQNNNLPNADAIVNPKLFKSKDHRELNLNNLSGVGVAFYTLICLRRIYLNQQQNFPNLSKHLDLVALGTIADLVELDQNNRILCQCGLEQIRSGKGNMGILALINSTKLNYQDIVSGDISYSIAPRLNAVGRLQDMSHGVNLLINKNQQEVEYIANTLNDLNQERKLIENQMIEQSIKQLNYQYKQDLPEIICSYLADGHEGVIGICASRLKNYYDKPALVACDSSIPGKIKASLRSVETINIHESLELAAKDLPADSIIFGGHRMAAGLTINATYFSSLCQNLNSIIKEKVSNNAQEKIFFDAHLPSEKFNINFAKTLSRLEPWGNGFPEPIFCNTFQVINTQQIGKSHTKFILLNEDGLMLEALWFFKLAQFQINSKIEMLFKLSINRFKNKEQLQLIVEYAKLLDS